MVAIVYQGRWVNITLNSLPQNCGYYHPCSCRVESRFAPSQWKMALLCNDVSHWGASLESALQLYPLVGGAMLVAATIVNPQWNWTLNLPWQLWYLPGKLKIYDILMWWLKIQLETTQYRLKKANFDRKISSQHCWNTLNLSYDNCVNGAILKTSLISRFVAQYSHILDCILFTLAKWSVEMVLIFCDWKILLSLVLYCNKCFFVFVYIHPLIPWVWCPQIVEWLNILQMIITFSCYLLCWFHIAHDIFWCPSFIVIFASLIICHI